MPQSEEEEGVGDDIDNLDHISMEGEEDNIPTELEEDIAQFSQFLTDELRSEDTDEDSQDTGETGGELAEQIRGEGAEQ